jgi:hypothetical protein
MAEKGTNVEQCKIRHKSKVVKLFNVVTSGGVNMMGRVCRNGRSRGKKVKWEVKG